MNHSYVERLLDRELVKLAQNNDVDLKKHIG